MRTRTNSVFSGPITGISETPAPWEPFLITKEEIEDEIVRLAEGPMPESGVRSSSIVHPQATDGIPSFTPGTEIILNVLKPGESSRPRRGNYSLLETCITGNGQVNAGKKFTVVRHDVWTVPAMQPYFHVNDSTENWVWLTYSNAALLQRTKTYYAEAGPFPDESIKPAFDVSTKQKENYNRLTAPDHELSSTGARLRGYEHLTDIEPVPNPAQHWAWADMEPYLPMREGDNNDPGKRGIWLLYNPATQRLQGTTPSYFATYASIAPGAPPYTGTRGHKHISASINYHIRGSGFSVVDGKRIDWKAGDLLLSAPSWTEHAHYHGEDGCTVLTVQDHPLHISMGSLLWQENMAAPILSLGNEDGQKGYVGPRETGK